MTILFNTDNNLTVHAAFSDKLKVLVEEKLNRYSERITRVEAHLSDENGHKSGENDKNCLLEIRVEGKPPIVVNASAKNYEMAVESAANKSKTLLEKVFGREKDHHV